MNHWSLRLYKVSLTTDGNNDDDQLTIARVCLDCLANHLGSTIDHNDGHQWEGRHLIGGKVTVITYLSNNDHDYWGSIERRGWPRTSTMMTTTINAHRKGNDDHDHQCSMRRWRQLPTYWQWPPWPKRPNGKAMNTTRSTIKLGQEYWRSFYWQWRQPPWTTIRRSIMGNLFDIPITFVEWGMVG